MKSLINSSVLSLRLSIFSNPIFSITYISFECNTIGDAGLSAINIAYPIEALIQALGTGIGMGGAVYYSINAAEKKGKRAEEFIAKAGGFL